MQWASNRINNSRPKASILCFLFATVVYHIWAERKATKFRSRNKKVGKGSRKLLYNFIS